MLSLVSVVKHGIVDKVLWKTTQLIKCSNIVQLFVSDFSFSTLKVAGVLSCSTTQQYSFKCMAVTTLCKPTSLEQLISLLAQEMLTLYITTPCCNCMTIGSSESARAYEA